MTTPDGFHVARRGFLKSCVMGLAAGAMPGAARAADAPPAPRARCPLKLGIRAASMRMVGDLGVLRAAAGMPGISGVELQVTSGAKNLRDGDVVRAYKRESDRWGIRVPSLSGVWDKGITLSDPKAPESLRLSIRAAEMLGCGVILVSFFKDAAPDMTREASYGPMVANLQAVAAAAADAGVMLGLENSLSPADNRKLVDLADRPSVGVYYDPFNMAFYGFGAETVPGVKLLGRRICAVHVKNEDKLIEEPGPIDWPAAFAAFEETGYDGWFVYETQHPDLADCVADTARNNAYVTRHARMPAEPVAGRAAT